MGVFLVTASAQDESVGLADDVRSADGFTGAIECASVGDAVDSEGFRPIADAVATKDVATAGCGEAGKRTVCVEAGRVGFLLVIRAGDGFKVNRRKRSVGTPHGLEFRVGNAGAGQGAVCRQAKVVDAIRLAPAFVR